MAIKRVESEAALWLNNTPVGSLHIGASRNGLAYIRFTDPQAINREASVSHPSVNQTAQNILEETARQLKAYFSGKRTIFNLPLDLSGLTTFTRKVLELTARIPFGQVVTYGALAASAGSPKGARAAGGAMRSNPIPIVIPCHRVLSSDYKLHGYSAWGGLAAKATLLKLEGLRVIGEHVLADIETTFNKI